MRVFLFISFVVIPALSFPHSGKFNSRAALTDLKARFYTKTTINDFVDIPITDLDKLVDRSEFSFAKKTVVYIHGYTESVTEPSVKLVVGAYLNKGNVNIIAIDWSKLAVGDYFTEAIPNAKWIGANIAPLFNNMIKKGVKINLLHIVAHSLGTHLSGFLGKALQKNYNIKLDRISALDPAGPGFDSSPAADRLAASDAIMVDSIHTDPQVFGFPTNLGTASFWPNFDVTVQPGCPTVPPTDKDAFCSHQRSFMFWAESITNPRAFNSLNKDTNQRAYMGESYDRSNTGVFRLKTVSKSPFGLGDAGLP